MAKSKIRVELLDESPGGEDPKAVLSSRVLFRHTMPVSLVVQLIRLKIQNPDGAVGVEHTLLWTCQFSRIVYAALPSFL